MCLCLMIPPRPPKKLLLSSLVVVGVKSMDSSSISRQRSLKIPTFLAALRPSPAPATRCRHCWLARSKNPGRSLPPPSRLCRFAGTSAAAWPSALGELSSREVHFLLFSLAGGGGGGGGAPAPWARSRHQGNGADKLAITTSLL